jgi:hypothetical protein
MSWLPFVLLGLAIGFEVWRAPDRTARRPWLICMGMLLLALSYKVSRDVQAREHQRQLRAIEAAVAELDSTLSR